MRLITYKKRHFIIDDERKKRTERKLKIEQNRRNKLIYIISSGDFFKIGISNNPQKRLKTIQTSAPQPAFLRKIYNPSCLARNLEAEAHRRLDKFRARGEWFDIKAIDKAFNFFEVASLCEIQYDFSPNPNYVPPKAIDQEQFKKAQKKHIKKHRKRQRNRKPRILGWS